MFQIAAGGPNRLARQEFLGELTWLNVTSGTTRADVSAIERMFRGTQGTTMRGAKLSAWLFAAFVLLAIAAGDWVTQATAQTATGEQAAGESSLGPPNNDLCLGCHGAEGFAMPGADGQMRDLNIRVDEFKESVHGKRFCVECHKDIVEIPHRPGVDRKVGCVECHRSLWDAALQQNKTGEFARLGVVVKQIESYMRSVHARPNIEDQSRTNATCYDCHNAHYVTPIHNVVGAHSRLAIPEICGRCHTEELADYKTSVHGQELTGRGNTFAAVCTDCHTTHEIESPDVASIRVAITRNCGNCHEEELESYLGTYHGQVSTLGYAYTAKCFDCHGNHDIKRVSNEASLVHPDNRIETCRKCHEDATAGFASFQPHGNTGNFERYPYLWLAGKGMGALLIGVFAFFWTHSALWFYREYKDRKQGRSRPHVQMNELPRQEKKYFKRWPVAWRLVHLVFALAIMTLVLTGTSVLYGESAWAQWVIDRLGGPRTAAIVHRFAAATFIALFFGHLVYVFYYLSRNWRTFQIFGPTSTVPNLQDLWDVIAMFKWFFGMAPRPLFDHWTYWKKFDYWAPFWGMVIIGLSGLMLWFPAATASILPGWVFNIATLVHGEEAFLAAVFLFSVHFFNVHFRPEKFPMDILMFTGVMPLEEYKREHTLEYRRLLESGELEKYLVDAPSRPMTVGSKILGTVLILIGLTLLVLVLIGFGGDLFSA
jgi:cytochrome b subunit of formate dehydrogenase